MVVTGLELAVTAVVVAGLRVLPAIVTGVVVAMVMTVVMVGLTCMVMVVAGRVVGAVARLHGTGGPERDRNRGSEPCQPLSVADLHL